MQEQKSKSIYPTDGIKVAFLQGKHSAKERSPIVQAHECAVFSELPPEEVIFGRTPFMEIARAKLERVAPTTIPVLLQGESGTGKEILAKLLHARSDRARAAWVKVTCPAIPNSLIESELFGYEKGAFTGAYTRKRGRAELAHRGSLFLDEVGSLDLSVQAKLLQLLQDGSFARVGGHETRQIDARIISAANGDLRTQVETRCFRPDLLARINAVTIELPPLRDRIADLPILVDYFLEMYSREYRIDPKPLSRGVARLMQNFDWPGNIRQLENMIRGYILIGNEEALANDLMPGPVKDAYPEIDLASPISLKQVTKAATRNLEMKVIMEVLRANGWSRQKTAKWLNISYRSLLYKLDGAQIIRRAGPYRTRSEPQ